MLIDFRPIVRLGGDPAHGQPVLLTGVLLTCFVRGLPAGKENDLVELQCIPGDTCDVDVAQMDGIKGAAEQADVLGCGWLALCGLIWLGG